MKTCPHCKESFEFEIPQQFGAHIVNCESNPKLKERLKCNKNISVSNFERHYNKCNTVNKKQITVDESWKVDVDKYKCPHCELIFHKLGICGHIFQMHTPDGVEYKNKKYSNAETKSKMGWSRGLTKETDNRVNKASEQQKEMYATGKRIHHQLGKPLSSEQKSKISKSHSKMLEENEISNNFKHVKFYKQKNIIGEEYSLRGKYELKMSQWLNDNKILWIRKIYIQYIKEGVEKTYVPDFYLPNFNLYIETKGYYSIIDKTKMSLVLEQNNINVKMIFKKTIDNLNSILTIDELLLE